MTPQPGNRDLDLLSAYLDGALPSTERTHLEARLQQEPDLRAALDDLRQTVRLIRAVPRLAPPRNFTLDPAKYRRRTPWWARFGMFQVVGAVGAAASIAIIALGLVLFTNTASPAFQAPAAGGAVAPQGAALMPTATLAQALTNAKTAGELAATLAATSDALSPANVAGASDQGGAGGSAVNASPTRVSALPKQIPTQTLTQTPSSTPTAMPAMPTATQRAALSDNAQLGPQAPSVQSGAAGAAQSSAPTVQPATPTAIPLQATMPARPTSVAVLPSPMPNAAQQMQQGQETSVSQSQPSPVPATMTDQLNAPFGASENARVSPSPSPFPSSTPSPFASPAPAPTSAVSFAASPAVAQPANTLAAKDRHAPEPNTAGEVLLIAGIALLVLSAMVFGLGWLRSHMGPR